MEFRDEERVRQISGEGGCLTAIFMMVLIFFVFHIAINAHARYDELENAVCEQAQICLPPHEWKWAWEFEKDPVLDKRSPNG